MDYGHYGDARQIDGLGGADPLTSKIAIIAPSTKADSDIDHSLIQVIVGEDVLMIHQIAAIFYLPLVPLLSKKDL